MNLFSVNAVNFSTKRLTLVFCMHCGIMGESYSATGQFKKKLFESQLEASCTLALLNLSFLLEYEALKSIRHKTQNWIQVKTRAKSSQELLSKNQLVPAGFFNIPKISGGLGANKVETTLSDKHLEMWRDLKRRSQASQKECLPEEHSLAPSIAKALVLKEFKTALKLLIPQISQVPSNQLLYEWIQRLYAYTQKSPGNVTIEHVK